MSVMWLALSFVSSVLIWVEVCMLECEVSVDLFGVWFECGTFLVSWSLRYDMLTAQMLLTVTG